MRAHHLRVESCKWHGGSSICDKCECGEVQDEKHVLFFCKCVEDSFGYLGMVFYRTLNMAKSADHAARPFLASAYRIRRFMREHALADRPQKK